MKHEGHFYKLNKSQNGKHYFICATPNVFCKGTAVQLIDGTIKANKHHSHDPYGEAFNELEDRRSFRSTLIERSRTETESLRSIYDGESIRDPRAAILYSWPSAESSMRHARRQTLPPLPSTLRELGEYFDLNAERYRCNNSSFYQEWIIDNAGKYSIMFSCQELISAVVHQGATELHADATFKVVPSTPHCQQLFIIHLILQNHSIPVCFVFMEAKTEASYRKVMERFQIKFPEVKPLVIMTDFETALRNAFMYIYPEAQIFSCWFHYVQCLQKNIKRMGYSGYIGQNREAKMCLRMCAALALLPANKIEQGFQEIKNYAHNNEILIPSFWLIRKGPECFSVHGQPRRTNNNVESFHSTLKQTFQVMHPNLWTMLEHLKNISKKMHIVVDQLSAGLPTTRRVKFKYILNSKRIKNSTALLSTGAITIKEFLIQCSYCTDQYLTTELSWHEEIEESEEEIVPMILNMPIAVDAEAIALNHDEVVDLEGMYNANYYLPTVLPDKLMVFLLYWAKIESEEEIEPMILNMPIAIAVDAEAIALNHDEAVDLEDPEVLEINEYNEADFYIPEDAEFAIWEENLRGEEVDEVPYFPVSLNSNRSQRDDEDICVVCRDGLRTHALIPCGHKVLCADCLSELDPQRCPICNSNYTSFLRIW